MSAAKRSHVSAGLLMYRVRDGALEVFLAHPGGPFFARRDAGAWTIPKGEIEPGDGPEETARREFAEETGLAPTGDLIALGSIKQKGGKTVHAWAFAGAWDDGAVPDSNTFEIEWPRGSGRQHSFPEIDRAAFFSVDEARAKANPAQVAFIDRLIDALEL